MGEKCGPREKRGGTCNVFFQTGPRRDGIVAFDICVREIGLLTRTKVCAHQRGHSVKHIYSCDSLFYDFLPVICEAAIGISRAPLHKTARVCVVMFLQDAEDRI